MERSNIAALLSNVRSYGVQGNAKSLKDNGVFSLRADLVVILLPRLRQTPTTHHMTQDNAAIS